MSIPGEQSSFGTIMVLNIQISPNQCTSKAVGVYMGALILPVNVDEEVSSFRVPAVVNAQYCVSILVAFFCLCWVMSERGAA